MARGTTKFKAEERADVVSLCRTTKLWTGYRFNMYQLG